MLYFTLNAFYEDSFELWESYSRFMAKENRAMEIRHLIQRPSRANRRSRIAVDRAAMIPSFHPTDHSRRGAGPNCTKQKSPRNRQTLQSCAGSGLWDRRTGGNQGIMIHEEHVQLSVLTGSPQGHLKPVSFIPLNWEWGQNSPFG